MWECRFKLPQIPSSDIIAVSWGSFYSDRTKESQKTTHFSKPLVGIAFGKQFIANEETAL